MVTFRLIKQGSHYELHYLLQQSDHHLRMLKLKIDADGAKFMSLIKVTKDPLASIVGSHLSEYLTISLFSQRQLAEE